MSKSRTIMRRKDRAMPDQWTKAFLKRAGFCQIATVDSEGQPFITSNTFAYDEDANAVYLHSAAQGHFRTTIEAEPRVALTVAEMGKLLPSKIAMEFSAEFSSVVLFGK